MDLQARSHFGKNLGRLVGPALFTGLSRLLRGSESGPAPPMAMMSLGGVVIGPDVRFRVKLRLIWALTLGFRSRVKAHIGPKMRIRV